MQEQPIGLQITILFINIREDQIIIVKGAKGKEKTVEVRDKSEEELRQIMDSIP